MIARLRGLVVVAVIAVTHVALWRLPIGVRGPARIDGPALGRWLTTTPSEQIVGAGLHLVALALTGYLLVVTVLGLVARLLGGCRAIALTDRITPRLVRSVLARAVPVIVATATITPALGAVAAAAAAPVAVVPPVAVLSRLADRPDPMGSARAAITGPAMVAPATITLDPAVPVVIVPGVVAPASNVPAAPAPPPPTLHVVQRGEHFWSIAAATTTARLGRPATRSEVAAYWLRLVDANRARLVEGANPGLLFAGQELVLPD